MEFNLLLMDQIAPTNYTPRKVDAIVYLVFHMKTARSNMDDVPLSFCSNFVNIQLTITLKQKHIHEN